MLNRLLNTARFARRALSPKGSRSAGPYKLNLMVTSQCNQRCRHCGIWSRNEEDLPLEIIITLLRSCRDLSWLDLTGGEIFLRPDIEAVFDTIHMECRDLALLHFPTNGTKPKLTVKITREILSRKGPRLVVTVSLDGPPDVHNAVRGSDSAFESALETYLRLKEIPDCRVYLGMTLLRENSGLYEETLEAVRKKAPRVDPGDLHVNLPNTSTHYYGDFAADLPDRDALRKEVERLLTARHKGRRPADYLVGYPLYYIERRYLQLALDHLSHGYSPIPCRALSSSCFVNSDGTVYPCVMWDRPLGSLGDTDGDLQAIWEGAAAEEARSTIARGGCSGCWTPCEAIPAILADYLPPMTRIRKPAEKAAVRI